MGNLTHHLRRAGVCVATGYGIKLFVQRGELVVEDGIGRDRRKRVYSRATHGISRLVVIGSDGFISLEAIRWLHRLGIALIHLDRDGNILATSAPNSGDVRVRRLQALAGTSETGLEIARMLLQTKRWRRLLPCASGNPRWRGHRRRLLVARGWIHTVHDTDKGVWRNEVEGTGPIRGSFKTKTEATQAGRERARREKTEHVIHNMNGRIGSRNSYGRDDPRKPG